MAGLGSVLRHDYPRVVDEREIAAGRAEALSRKLQERRIFPAVDIERSSTRREDLLLGPDLLQRVWLMRRMYIQMISPQPAGAGMDQAVATAKELISEAIAEHTPEARYVIVNEAGASVYSASTVAREEFPDFDATVRGTISIGRRLQDPLSELVKIEPQHIGVGMYQHDVSAKLLKESLDQVIESRKGAPAPSKT